MPIFGVDLSDFDRGRGPVDVASMARDGIVFLTHKATEGTRTQHVHYGRTLNAARAAGIPLLGAYLVPRTPGNGGHGTIAQQVDYYLSYLDAQTPWWRKAPEFFHQVDSEHWGYDDVSPALGAQMCSMLRAKTGQWVVHYAPRWGYGNTIPGSDPLWASSYGANPATPYRQAYPGDNSSGWAPYSGRTPTFLQYGSRLTIGSQPGCDGNAFRGTLDQLRSLITGGNSMALIDDAYFAALVWRMDGIVYARDQTLDGPTKGEPIEPIRMLKRIDANAQAAAQAASAASAAVAPTQDQIDAAMLRALSDPTVISALGAAVASHIHVS